MIPFNDKFNDTYWSVKDPLAQSVQVFSSVARARAEEIIAQGGLCFSPFIVAELGFGAGLNFITTVNEFSALKTPLHYVSVEKFPLSAKKIEQIYTDFALPRELDLIAKRLIHALSDKSLKAGFNRFIIDEFITLDILFGEAEQMLRQSDFCAHCWYLDGFAPAKNPDMWSEAVFSEVARLSEAGTVVSTYSAASILQKGLKVAGFSVSKLKGVGKRERVSAVLLDKLAQKKLDDIYFQRPDFKFKSAPKVLVVGAGIAGVATARILSQMGCVVVLAEKSQTVANNGSSNEIGELMPLITSPGVLLGDFHSLSCDMASEFYAKNLSKELCLHHDAYAYAFNETLKNRYLKRDDFSPVTNVVRVRNAACLRPKKTCEFLAKGLDVRLLHEFVGFEALKDGYEARFKFKDGIVSIKSDAIVFCMGSHSKQLFGRDYGDKKPILSFDDSVQISSVRGQTTLIKDAKGLLERGYDANATHSAKGYLTAAFNGARVCGASFSREDYERQKRDSDDTQNLADISEFLSQKPEILGSNVGFRSYSGDRFAIIGPLHDTKAYERDYGAIFWGKKSDKKPNYHRGLFINSAHGARGLGSAILGANLIADLIFSRPLCLNKELFAAIHPARFMIRKLKKGLK
ncbi:bifunctional tRNA (5-methylaminomethyl-2-thiouridine)(34)-methyltransferase MnmD/FAD-dependent 5-carboxymethylaminomethyl-2-thiouridine(34) oxidoreductase MnmC [Campylobacter sp. 19-13652]|uniref:bifunctional tRNA (5-methylaminomethyl-2-thiouridine)(34)-methyltransferase MnmD/FAD-dependent 5-carboxymethylaminomethyl-2-thiouridine(34) oxidoreductase MnmC n=1 Tax=Campylobacter sp. 19-13652 TaxID=2840180 RepID=UPI001C78ED9C|nr:bifunctional tRNA (5-methylaminomethyl-2-thiouridine)(34)-methyltransferase MnmD/FAD-dependent 5-carboxymethylaminomethyl-2-thiouridine(34) oxidoreductase MnmC [Campylobacter sp. 19-13652]BCX79758.1 tRNA 5-methylaminomethyl-2-thiouridine biosynthesis bifunctional protein MnmC [Campylobacter sp. 19-13652]